MLGMPGLEIRPLISTGKKTRLKSIVPSMLGKKDVRIPRVERKKISKSKAFCPRDFFPYQEFA